MSRAVVAVSLFVGCGLLACAGDEPTIAGEAEATAAPKVAPLPGAPTLPDALAVRLAAAVLEKGAEYRPRTEHLEDDGTPTYTNRLILESSPYLEQHAHNPVNWFPWGDEAFETARRLGRPVFLSVGYSTCHWCHVMEKESFEDVEIARYLNEHYIAIKVDREERPDVDAIYMAAVQAISGRGGWPMSVWLTPDRKPFYGGTYFPPRDGDRGAPTGFLTLLGTLASEYDGRPEEIASIGDRISRRIRRHLGSVAGTTEALPDEQAIGQILEQARAYFDARFDPRYGGTRPAPKFPSNFPSRLLLREYLRTGNRDELDKVTLTLEKMASGGIHDHLAGGFHRYTVDETWLVPHFEKMLYDNAQLAVVYLEAWQATGREPFAEVARRILRYLAREMTSPEGALYSATDADSRAPSGDPEEGRFFTWTPDELREVLGPEKARVAAAYFGVTEQGNFEGRTVLTVRRPIEGLAAEFDVSPDRLRATLAEAVEGLYRARLRRPPPFRDDKILASWNGLAISAFAVGGQVLGDRAFVARAEQAAEFVLTRMRRDGRLSRSFRDGEARHHAYLDDYAFLIAGLLDLYEATWEPRWLREAIALQETLDEHYAAPGGGYYLTSDDHEELLAREKPSYDGAEPSGNSVALMNLVRLHELTTDDRYRARADAVIRSFEPILSSAAAGLTEMLLALEFRQGTPKEIVIVTRGPKTQALPFLAELHGVFLPHRVLVVASEGEDLDAQSKLVPLLKGKVAKQGKPTAYVCENHVCRLPTTDVAVFAEQLASPPAPTPTPRS